MNIYLIYKCTTEPIINVVFGCMLCIGGVISYSPQIYAFIKSNKNNEEDNQKNDLGVSELSLLCLCLGSACLSTNTFILNWYKFKCYNYCSFANCSSHLLSSLQIYIGWLMVFPLYLIFLRHKIKYSENRVEYDLKYLVVYVFFISFMVLFSVLYKIESKNSKYVFSILAQILGLIAALCSCIVWIPQIKLLLKTQKQGQLSLLMFILQTPGNAFVIMLQILYHQNWTTWFPYVINLTEQSIIVIILLFFKYRDYKNNKNNLNNNFEIINNDVDYYYSLDDNNNSFSDYV